jgi:hypothetical protein
MKKVYLPLPTLPPPKFKTSVSDLSRLVNWIPATKLHVSILSAFPQNIEEFNNWAQAAHTPDHYMDLQQVHDYMHHANEFTPAARTPLMNHALASWRLPTWLPEEQQSVCGVC